MVTLKRAFERDFAWEPGKYILLWTREDKLRQLLRTNTNGGTQSETAPNSQLVTTTVLAIDIQHGIFSSQG